MNSFNIKTVNINRKVITVKMFQKSLIAVINSCRKIPKLNIVSKHWENGCLNIMILLISIGLQMFKLQKIVVPRSYLAIQTIRVFTPFEAVTKSSTKVLKMLYFINNTAILLKLRTISLVFLALIRRLTDCIEFV